MCASGGMVDTLALGASALRREGENCLWQFEGNLSDYELRS
jgi:hypothetical protein